MKDDGLTPQQRIKERYRAEGRCWCGRRPENGLTSCGVCQKKWRKKYRTNRNDPKFVALSRKPSRQSYQAIKKEVFEHYGGFMCACCGEHHKEFLSIDHIKPVGVAGRKKAQGGTRLYAW